MADSVYQVQHLQVSISLLINNQKKTLLGKKIVLIVFKLSIYFFLSSLWFCCQHDLEGVLVRFVKPYIVMHISLVDFQIVVA